MRPSSAVSTMPAARVAVQVALPSPALPTRLRFGRCEVLPETRSVRVDGVLRPVRRKVMELILLLLRHGPDAVPRELILARIWPRAAGSPAGLARAVLEARRALGDDPEQPTLIVTVRGIGYRFAGTLQPELEPLADDAAAAVDATLREVRLLLRHAQEALDRDNDRARARRHAERALALAELEGHHIERATALSWCAWLALQDRQAEVAARQSGLAVSIARTEQHAGTLALALLSDAHVRCVVGNFVGALQRLQEAHPLLQAGAPAARRHDAEQLLATVHRELDELEQALAWCTRARDTAVAGGLPLHAQRAVCELAALHLRRGDALHAAGKSDCATQAWQAGLALAREVVHNESAARDPWIAMGATGHAAALLARLGWLAEARQQFTALEEALARWPGAGGPLLLQRRLALHCERAHMEADCMEHALAWADLQCALDLAGEPGADVLLPGLYRTAATVLEKAGRYEEALGWAQREREAAAALRKAQAARLAAVLHAEAATLRLRQDIDAARAQLGALQREVQALRKHVRTLEALVPRDPHTGLLPQTHMLAMLQRAHHQARARGLPFCLGLVRVDNLAALQQHHAPEMLATVFRRIARWLGRALPGSLALGPAAQWGNDAVVVAIERMGLHAAGEAMALVAQELDAVRWGDLAGGLQLQLRAAVCDAATAPSLEDAARALHDARAAGQVWPRAAAG